MRFMHSKSPAAEYLVFEAAAADVLAPFDSNLPEFVLRSAGDAA